MAVSRSMESAKKEITEKIMAICHEDTSIADVQNIQFHSYASTTNHVSFEAGTNKYFASVLGPYISRNNLEFEV